MVRTIFAEISPVSYFQNGAQNTLEYFGEQGYNYQDEDIILVITYENAPVFTGKIKLEYRCLRVFIRDVLFHVLDFSTPGGLSTQTIPLGKSSTSPFTTSPFLPGK